MPRERCARAECDAILFFVARLSRFELARIRRFTEALEAMVLVENPQQSPQRKSSEDRRRGPS